MPKVQVGKETVKFLAIFDHCVTGGASVPASRERPDFLMILPSRLPQNFLAPPYDCAIVPRILDNRILNEMDNHGT